MNSKAASFNMIEVYSFAEWFMAYSVPLAAVIPCW